jgi:hypothetical protein
MITHTSVTNSDVALTSQETYVLVGGWTGILIVADEAVCPVQLHVMAERVRQPMFGEQVSDKDAVQSSREKSLIRLIF